MAARSLPAKRSSCLSARARRPTSRVCRGWGRLRASRAPARMAESSSARRLERRLNRSLDARAALGRAAESAPSIAQIVLAAMLAWLIAHEMLGHPTPAIALVSTLTILGFNRDARPRRGLESAVGILVGIVLSEVALLVVGSGWWQLAIVLTVTLFVARLVSPSAPFAIAAGVQSILVMVLPAPDGGVFTRSIDGL